MRYSDLRMECECKQTLVFLGWLIHLDFDMPHHRLTMYFTT